MEIILFRRLADMQRQRKHLAMGGITFNPINYINIYPTNQKAAKMSKNELKEIAHEYAVNNCNGWTMYIPMLEVAFIAGYNLKQHSDLP